MSQMKKHPHPDQFHAGTSNFDAAISTGIDTVWIVENTAKSPVVISYV